MLNIINLIKKNKEIKILKRKGNTVNTHIRNIPLSKEWCNSLYSFSKNSIKHLPAVHDSVFKLLKMHFNMYNQNLETNKFRIRRKIKRSLVNNKIWVSTPEIKHFNKKAIMTFYVYSKIYHKCKKQLDQLEFTWSPKIINVSPYFFEKNKKIKKIKVIKRLSIIRRTDPIYIGTKISRYLKTHDFYLKVIQWLKWEKLLLKKAELNTKSPENLKYINLDRYDYLIYKFQKELTYFKLKQKILFNKFKFNEVYLDILINWLQIIYKKKIILNIVILKHYFLSSSILAQIVTAKLVDKKNRGRSLLTILGALGDHFIPNLSGKNVQKEEKKSIGMQNTIYNIAEQDYKYDSLNRFLSTNRKFKLWSSKYIDNFAMQNIENKSVAGIFIRATGRLTKRYKAQRSLDFLKYRGTLKNVYSAHKGYSSALSRGHSNINVEKTIMHSKLRIGAFGLTGWVSSY